MTKKGKKKKRKTSGIKGFLYKFDCMYIYLYVYIYLFIFIYLTDDVQSNIKLVFTLASKV